MASTTTPALPYRPRPTTPSPEVTGAASAAVLVAPVVTVAALLTATAAGPARFAAGVAALVLGGLAHSSGGLAVGYALPAKAPPPLTRPTFFPVTFGGGPFLRPRVFLGWPRAVPTASPSRSAATS